MAEILRALAGQPASEQADFGRWLTGKGLLIVASVAGFERAASVAYASADALSVAVDVAP